MGPEAGGVGDDRGGELGDAGVVSEEEGWGSARRADCESGVSRADRGSVRAVGCGAVARPVEGGVWVAGAAGRGSARSAVAAWLWAGGGCSR